MPSKFALADLPHDIFHHLLSTENTDVLDILALKQTNRTLRERIEALLSEHPAIYREKLTTLAQTIPTGLPKDLSRFSTAQLEVAAASAYATERAWRSDSPELTTRVHESKSEIEDTIIALKVVPGGRWVIAATESGLITIWDSVEEQIVAQEESTEPYGHLIDLEITDQGNVMMAVTGSVYNYDTEDMIPALTVYRLGLDPPPVTRNDGIIYFQGHALAPKCVGNPTIRGHLACGTLEEKEWTGEVCILVYNWMTDAGNILRIDLCAYNYGNTFRSALSLVILPQEILLYQCYGSSSFVHTVRIPELGDMDQGLIGEDPFDDEYGLPHLIDAVPGFIVSPTNDGIEVDVGRTPCRSSVVEVAGSSSSTFLAALSIEIEGPSHIVCNFLELTPSAAGLLVDSSPRLKRAVRVPNYTPDDPLEGLPNGLGGIRLVDIRPLMALGRTGRCAVWVESSLQQGNGGLVGFAFAESDGWKSRCGRETDIGAPTGGLHDTQTQVFDSDMQTPEYFRGASPLRHLPTPDFIKFDEVTALGLDESTGTVAVGDSLGHIWVLNYGPRN